MAGAQKMPELHRRSFLWVSPEISWDLVLFKAASWAQRPGEVEWFGVGLGVRIPDKFL